MAENVRPGYYQDKEGNWQVDRRSGVDRRSQEQESPYGHERRRLFRRQIDREVYERDHKKMIDEALADFADQHDGHL